MNDLFPRPGQMIAAQNHYYSMDSYKTGLNNNVLIVGTSGSGKTRSIIIPNLLQIYGSYIVSDPKGALHRRYAPYLRQSGYEVKCLNFMNPTESSHYNFFEYINTEQDILKIAHMIVFADTNTLHKDPFWDQSAEMLLASMIAYCKSSLPPVLQNLRQVNRLLEDCEPVGEWHGSPTNADLLFNELPDRGMGAFAKRLFRKVSASAEDTFRSVLITLSAKIGRYDTEELNTILADNTVEIEKIGKNRTALFVIVPDTDRSMDTLANIFFTQAMNILCNEADLSKDQHLDRHVCFILDDFASSIVIADFPKLISTIRSRNMSAMLAIQAESQLKAIYSADSATIIGNCDTYIYLGCNDIDTARQIAIRANRPLSEILYMEVGTNWIFRRGMKPLQGKNFKLETYEDMLIRRNGYGYIPSSGNSNIRL